MKRSFLCGLFLSVATFAAAADAKDAAVKKERQQMVGTWQIVTVEIDGQKMTGTDASKYRVVNGDDGSWSLQEQGREIDRGTSTIDPTRSPKTIDLTPTTGDARGK